MLWKRWVGSWKKPYAENQKGELFVVFLFVGWCSRLDTG